jgi:hypothetical protein
MGNLTLTRVIAAVATVSGTEASVDETRTHGLVVDMVPGFAGHVLNWSSSWKRRMTCAFQMKTSSGSNHLGQLSASAFETPAG